MRAYAPSDDETYPKEGPLEYPVVVAADQVWRNRSDPDDRLVIVDVPQPGALSVEVRPENDPAAASTRLHVDTLHQRYDFVSGQPD